eukprot:gnl/TRDRNA2_/TRDRNA2_169374_c1_seq1.p1 gnl/TRDRNA2_/TRDRNA2_169374_c1~~gnl/TRDRNA2_/TRDRNA2_169374_c1_seq1.p1  ORF type:complete len:452 (-),score=87.16 gnl/TRDRNA2_/TRDRNA2_169374_c1_seq1:33-1388(-)
MEVAEGRLDEGASRGGQNGYPAQGAVAAAAVGASPELDRDSVVLGLVRAMVHDNTVMACNMHDYEAVLSAALTEMYRLRSEVSQMESVCNKISRLQELLAAEMRAHAKLRQENTNLAAQNEELMSLIMDSAEAGYDTEYEAFTESLIIENEMLRKLHMLSRSRGHAVTSSPQQVPQSPPRTLLSLGGRTRSHSSGSTPSSRASPPQQVDASSPPQAPVSIGTIPADGRVEAAAGREASSDHDVNSILFQRSSGAIDEASDDAAAVAASGSLPARAPTGASSAPGCAAGEASTATSRGTATADVSVEERRPSRRDRCSHGEDLGTNLDVVLDDEDMSEVSSLVESVIIPCDAASLDRHRSPGSTSPVYRPLSVDGSDATLAAPGGLSMVDASVVTVGGSPGRGGASSPSSRAAPNDMPVDIELPPSSASEEPGSGSRTAQHEEAGHYVFDDT